MQDAATYGHGECSGCGCSLRQRTRAYSLYPLCRHCNGERDGEQRFARVLYYSRACGREVETGLMTWEAAEVLARNMRGRVL